MTKEWSNLAKVVYKRTYARKIDGKLENWKDTVERVISGNIKGHKVSKKEIDKLKELMIDRKAMPAGRGLWFSGAEAADRIGGAALCNCWFLTSDDWKNFVIAQDLLMLGGGVGLSVEHRFVTRLPKVKRDVSVSHQNTKDADFIVPDSREGWCALTEKILESFFVTGKSFTFSTICVRGAGEPIDGFGGKASGPLPLIKFTEKLCKIFTVREGKHIRPIDAMDILCCIGEMVVAGNVRRSAIIILGDPWDKEYLKAKRWDLGPIPTERAMANLSVVCDDIEDLHPSFWKTYSKGEPFGLINRKNIQKFGRMGERKRDKAIGVNPCAEATLENGEPCNLFELFLANFKNREEAIEAARLAVRYALRVTTAKYHHELNQKVISKNRRIGIGITGCLQSSLFNPEDLDAIYESIQEESESYSEKLGVPTPVKTTVVKPSGTVSLLGDVTAGIHPAYSRYYIRRVRFSSNDPLIPALRAAGHPMEPVKKFDGSTDPNTLVVDFFCKAPEGTPIADEDFDSWKQLEVVKMAQKHWADQSVSVTVYYKKEELKALKDWLKTNYRYLKTISFLCHSEHGFDQAPLEVIDEETYAKMSKKIKSLEEVSEIGEDLGDQLECEGGVCPVK